MMHSIASQFILHNDLTYGWWQLWLLGFVLHTASIVFLPSVCCMRQIKEMQHEGASHLHKHNIWPSLLELTHLKLTDWSIILFLTIWCQLYTRVVLWLTEWELHRTQTEHEDSLTLKMYLLQFVNYYSSIFYIAFFKGQWVGHPGDYNRIFNFRQEEVGGWMAVSELSGGLCFVEWTFLNNFTWVVVEISSDDWALSFSTIDGHWKKVISSLT